MALSTDIYAEVTTTFPASVLGAGGITIAKSGGVYTISFAGSVLMTIGVDTASAAALLVAVPQAFVMTTS